MVSSSSLPVLLALQFRLLHQYRRFLWMSGAAILVFRAEAAVLLGLCLLSDHVSCSFRTEVLNNVLVLLWLGGETGGCYRQVAATVVSLDRLHCVLNKSSQWGISYNSCCII